MWTGVVSLAEKLNFIQQQLINDRAARALRDLQKDAAVKIATWYRSILLRQVPMHAKACMLQYV